MRRLADYELHDWTFLALLAMTWPVLIAIAGVCAVGWVLLQAFEWAIRFGQR